MPRTRWAGSGSPSGRAPAAAALGRSQTSMLSLREAALAEYGCRHRADRERRWAETVRSLRAVTAVPAGIQDRAGSPGSADDA